MCQFLFDYICENVKELFILIGLKRHSTCYFYQRFLMLFYIFLILVLSGSNSHFHNL